MSAKKENKKKSGKKIALWVIIAVEILTLLVALLIWWAFAYTEKREVAASAPTEPATTAATTTATEAANPEHTEEPKVAEIQVDEGQLNETYLGQGLKITNIGAYTGLFVEDGSDEMVSDVLMLVVANEGNTDIEYAEISMPTDNGNAFFSVSTLPAGESVVLMEKNRMSFTGKEDILLAEVSSCAVFQEPLSLHEDQFKLQILDGTINVINVSGEDIAENIEIYYKNAASDLYYGGITYRLRIEGGIKADEIKQITTSHFSVSGSKIMFLKVV